VGDYELGLFLRSAITVVYTALCEFYLRWLQYSARTIEMVWYEAAKTGLIFNCGKEEILLCGSSWLC
jgi:hypothetical protein